MAVLTLRKLHRNLGYRSGREVKISRSSVRATIVVTNAMVRRDAVLRLLFDACTRNLPAQPCREPVVSA
jgi:farnesyl-diphosphate farnesyltransferase